MTHSELWEAVDTVAANLGLTRSGLAKECGLDPTAFNKSKRWTKYGKPRWPSGHTLSKVISTAGITDLEFMKLVMKK